MAEINWIQIIIGIIGGGAAGAFINKFFADRDKRIQLINYNLEVTPIYNHSDNPISSKIVFKEGKNAAFRT